MKIDEYERKRKHLESNPAKTGRLFSSSSILNSTAANIERINKDSDKSFSNRKKCLTSRSASVSSYSSSSSSSFPATSFTSSASHTNFNCTEMNFKHLFSNNKKRETAEASASKKRNYTVNFAALSPSTAANQIQGLSLTEENNSRSKLKRINPSQSHHMIDSPVLYTPLRKSQHSNKICSDKNAETCMKQKDDDVIVAERRRHPKPIWNNDPINLIKCSSNFSVHVSLYLLISIAVATTKKEKIVKYKLMFDFCNF